MDIEQEPTKFIERTLRTFINSQAAIHEYTELFTRSLFEALESFVNEFIEAGVPGLDEPRRYALPTGREALQLSILDYKIIFVPLAGAAWPNIRDEARIPSAKFKEECGRIAVFLGEDPKRVSFYDFLIWGDGSWFAWGYGWPKQADEYAQTDFRQLAVELRSSFVRDIHRTWKTRAETVLGPSTDASPANRAFNYGLPGEE
jgi:hypothetical protein